MAKVGSIKSYYDGAAYDVADIYDSKSTVVSNASPLILAHFNSTGVVDDCGNSWDIVNKDTSTYTLTSYLNTEQAKYGYAFHPQGFDKVYCESAVNIDLANKDFTVEFWHYTELLNNGDQAGNKIFSLFGSTAYTVPSISVSIYQSASGYAWVQFICRPNGKSYISAPLVNADKNLTFSKFFNRMNHLAFSYNKSTKIIYCFVNGALLKSFSTGTVISGNASALKFTRARIGSSYIYTSNNVGNNDVSPFGGAVSELMFRTNFAYPESGFDVPTSQLQAEIPVTGNIPIRHNNTTYYAPLIAAKTPPCLAVRHNNQTYYTVRS